MFSPFAVKEGLGEAGTGSSLDDLTLASFMAETENMVKVLLQDGKDVETLWAVPVGENL
jgi:hypothetical protein